MKLHTLVFYIIILNSFPFNSLQALKPKNVSAYVSKDLLARCKKFSNKYQVILPSIPAEFVERLYLMLVEDWDNVTEEIGRGKYPPFLDREIIKTTLQILCLVNFLANKKISIEGSALDKEIQDLSEKPELLGVLIYLFGMGWDWDNLEIPASLTNWEPNLKSL